MSDKEYCPGRGDIVWMNFNPRMGHEQAGTRPALVLSPDSYNRKTGLAIVCPITSQVKGYPFEVPLPYNLIVKGVILADQVKSLDWRKRLHKRACIAPHMLVKEVLNKLGVLLDA